MEGSIIIDGVADSQVALHDWRSKISIIPQEPVLFSGTLRKNLDPFDEHDDNTLWNVLEEASVIHLCVAERPALKQAAKRLIRMRILLRLLRQRRTNSWGHLFILFCCIV